MAEITQKSALKLGEVLAFSRVGQSIFDKAGSTLKQALAEKELQSIVDSFGHHDETIMRIAQAQNVQDQVVEKSMKTSEKLGNMQGLYLQEEDWSNPAEVMEWLGFFVGAGFVHWRLLEGVSSKSDNQELQQLVQNATSSYQYLLEQVGKGLFEIGENYQK